MTLKALTLCAFPLLPLSSLADESLSDLIDTTRYRSRPTIVDPATELIKESRTLYSEKNYGESSVVLMKVIDLLLKKGEKPILLDRIRFCISSFEQAAIAHVKTLIKNKKSSEVPQYLIKSVSYAPQSITLQLLFNHSIKTLSKEQQAKNKLLFYTNMYRALIRMNLESDANRLTLVLDQTDPKIAIQLKQLDLEKKKRSGLNKTSQ